MLRSFFIYLSKAAWAKNMVMGMSIARTMSKRFVAGEKLEDAIQAIRVLNSNRINATLDHLGESITNPDEARKSAQDVIDMLDAIAKTGVRSNVSIKLTQIGLALDPKLCAENLERILRRAAEQNIFLRIDMEDATVTQITLDLMRQARAKGYTNVGIVIQSYLYRSEKDCKQLAVENIPVRLCKGAYKEPAEVAYPKKSDVDASYDRCAAALMDGAKAHGSPKLSDDGRCPPPPGLATHDAKRIEFGKTYAQKISLPKEAMEFQMLYGIRRDLQEQLATEGYPVRVYVPFGTQWYPYFMRRLAERPANIWFFVSNFFRK